MSCQSVERETCSEEASSAGAPFGGASYDGTGQPRTGPRPSRAGRAVPGRRSSTKCVVDRPCTDAVSSARSGRRSASMDAWEKGEFRCCSTSSVGWWVTRDGRPVRVVPPDPADAAGAVRLGRDLPTRDPRAQSRWQARVRQRARVPPRSGTDRGGSARHGAACSDRAWRLAGTRRRRREDRVPLDAQKARRQPSGGVGGSRTRAGGGLSRRDARRRRRAAAGGRRKAAGSLTGCT